MLFLNMDMMKRRMDMGKRISTIQKGFRRHLVSTAALRTT
jgi:hypothetical protein